MQSSQAPQRYTVHEKGQRHLALRQDVAGARGGQQEAAAGACTLATVREGRKR